MEERDYVIRRGAGFKSTRFIEIGRVLAVYQEEIRAELVRVEGLAIYRGQYVQFLAVRDEEDKASWTIYRGGFAPEVVDEKDVPCVISEDMAGRLKYGEWEFLSEKDHPRPGHVPQYSGYETEKEAMARLFHNDDPDNRFRPAPLGYPDPVDYSLMEWER